ncbi:Signal transduction histidine kinase [Planifilum fulgidum]|uniref:histidine kinase n=1 Tax=Planifilum fulgidum TaxID=201973 RepID=A0A1I2NJ46_9BACL|nr:HAMP domain-containing sensor histidine kinase [Planifilum fulgidum]MBO2496302.1 sensor histidine kinase [Bacillota bacterium]MBO2531698.1 sensor histidine kinase [Thermoactinomycetaceae bacterium]SFG01476.1 Signal transduction histidine kinase [Planifilum fulgidum]
MGKINPPPSFRRQFIRLALSVILWSAVVSALIWLLLGLTLLLFFRPANYYEKQVPAILRFAEESGEKLLDPETRPLLEEKIPTEGIAYRVLPLEGGKGYGTLPPPEKTDPKQWIRKLNTTETREGLVYRYIPLSDGRGRLAGVLVLGYEISFLKANDSPLAAVVLILAMATPFVAIAFFAYWFGRRLERRISPAIDALMEGAARVERRDLDFTLGAVGGTRELYALGEAFEKMRHSLRTSLETQWRAEQGRREMLAALAHDLFTPLTIIRGHAENLLNRVPQEEGRLHRPLRAIFANSERAIRMLEEMQEANRLERADFSLSPSPLDLGAYLEEKKEEYLSLCNRKKIRLHFSLEDSRRRPRPMRLDGHRLSQILDNVITNALRYTPARGEIRWRVLLDEEGVEMEITDTGPGLSEEDLRRLFQPFYRGDPARKSGHAGLGMYIAKTLAEKHGGWITAGNAPGGGAKIRFRIAEL